MDDGDLQGPILEYINKMKNFNINPRLFMNFMPESRANMIIVPMNKHGDGYLVKCYDERYLRGIMTKPEFQHITREISRITAHAYSENRIVDVGEVPRRLVWMLVFSYVISFTMLVLMYLAIDLGPYPGLKPDSIFLGIMITLLAIGAGIAMAVMFLNYFAKDKQLPSYKERLEFYLSNYFDEINAAVFRRRGLIWKVGNNC